MGSVQNPKLLAIIEPKVLIDNIDFELHITQIFYLKKITYRHNETISI